MGSISFTLPEIRDYDIDPVFGFAASDVAFTKSLGPYYQPWEHIVSNLTSLLTTKQLRPIIQALPLLSINSLTSTAERRRAHQALACMVQAYVFEDADHPDPNVPPSISQPFLDICDFWGINPILSNTGYCLWNWRLNDNNLNLPQDTNPETIRTTLLSDLANNATYVSFTSTLSEKVFVNIPLLVEVEGGPLIPSLLSALHPSTTTSSLLNILQNCHGTLIKMATHLQTLHSHCDPQVFYHQIRPYITGSHSLPGGFVFHLSDNDQISCKHTGATAGQSPIFKFIDHVFGIQHVSDFPREMRAYMPRKHREFLEIMETLPSLRGIVAEQADVEVAEAFEQCVAVLREWRTKHVGIAMRFVVVPARQVAGGEEVKGTGGSSPTPFLKGMRDETV